MSKATAEDKRRITELFDQAYETDDSIENIFQRIAKEMPHVTDADIQEVAAVYAKEGRLDANGLMAQPQGAKQIAQIIEETERISGKTGLATETAVSILSKLAAQGNARANELLEKFNSMMPPQFPIEQTWKEMDEYLARNRAMGPPKTIEEQAQRNAAFWAIEERRIENRNRVLAAEALAGNKSKRT